MTLLAELLRASLTLGDRTTVSVAEELETVASYLALEQLRFERRLRVRARRQAGLTRRMAMRGEVYGQIQAP